MSKRPGPRTLAELDAFYAVPWRERWCALCRQAKVAGPGARFCCDQHRSLWHHRYVYAPEQQAEVLAEWGEDGPFYVVDCEHCGDKVQRKRPEARYCSSRCRTAAHRAEHRAAVTAED